MLHESISFFYFSVWSPTSCFIIPPIKDELLSVQVTWFRSAPVDGAVNEPLKVAARSWKRGSLIGWAEGRWEWRMWPRRCCCCCADPWFLDPLPVPVRVWTLSAAGWSCGGSRASPRSRGMAGVGRARWNTWTPAGTWRQRVRAAWRCTSPTVTWAGKQLVGTGEGEPAALGSSEPEQNPVVLFTALQQQKQTQSPVLLDSAQSSHFWSELGGSDVKTWLFLPQVGCDDVVRWRSLIYDVTVVLDLPTAVLSEDEIIFFLFR